MNENPAYPLVRPARDQDRQAMAEAHRASIAELCVGAYGEEAVRGWTAVIDPDVYIPALRDQVVLVAEEREGLTGLGILHPAEGMVGAVYVAPWAVGRGHGSLLLAGLEQEARDRGLGSLSVRSTLNAEGFYLRHGYRVVGRDEHRLKNGTVLACIVMVKTL